MLTPEYLNSFSSGYLGMCDVLNEQIIRDVARRIAKTGRITPTAEWQLKQAKQSGALMDDVIREVGVLTGKSDTEILRLFQDAGLSGMLQDAKPLLQAGKLKTSDIVLSGAMQRTMNDTALHNEMYRAVRSYLANTGLLNRGWVKEYDDKQ